MSIAIISGGPDALRANRRGWIGRVLPAEFDDALFALYLPATGMEMGPTYDYSHRGRTAISHGAVPDAAGFAAGLNSYYELPFTVTDVAAEFGEFTMAAVWEPQSSPCTAIGNFAGPSIPHMTLVRGQTDGGGNVSRRITGITQVKVTDPGTGAVTYQTLGPFVDNAATGVPTIGTVMETEIVTAKVGLPVSMYRRQKGATSLTKNTTPTAALAVIPTSPNRLLIGRDVLAGQFGYTGPCRVTAIALLKRYLDGERAAALDVALQAYLAGRPSPILN